MMLTIMEYYLKLINEKISKIEITMSEVKIFVNSRAVSKINKLKLEDIFVQQWMKEKTKICYILYINKNPVSFCLLSKCDFDPIYKFRNPKILNYVFTFESHRRKGYAATLLFHIIKMNELTAFCCTKESVNLLAKIGFTNFGVYRNSIMMRYPN